MKAAYEKNELKIDSKEVNGIRAFPPMFHAHIEIICLLSGKAEIVIDGISHMMKPGEIALVFPYSIHEYKAAPGAVALLSMFDPVVIGDFEYFFLNYKPVSPFICDDGSIQPLLRRIVDFSEREDDISVETAKAYICAAAGEILSRMNLKCIEGIDMSITQSVLIYCMNNYKSDITIKSVSEKLFVSTPHITRVFSSKLGVSFRDYINALRVSEAKKYLKYTNMKVTDIMYACGFKNQSSFNRIFSEVCSSTPTMYRNTAKPKISDALSCEIGNPVDFV